MALYATAVLFGAMVYFAGGIAPLIFTKLPAEHAGRFVRALFPIYYLWVLLCAVVAALALLAVSPLHAAAMAVIAASAAWLRQGLMPKINRLSDAAQAGDAAAKPAFDAAHRLSVIVNVAQMLVVAWVLARFA